MFYTELYALQSELDYRRERIASARSRRRTERRDPYLPWLLDQAGRKAL